MVAKVEHLGSPPTRQSQEVKQVPLSTAEQTVVRVVSRRTRRYQEMYQQGVNPLNTLKTSHLLVDLSLLQAADLVPLKIPVAVQASEGSEHGKSQSLNERRNG